MDEALDRIIRYTGAEDSSGLRTALTNVLHDIWRQGYDDGYRDAEQEG